MDILKIKQFLKNFDGDDDGRGVGFGRGDGYGNGICAGRGDGAGNKDSKGGYRGDNSNGNGHGDGNGNGIEYSNGYSNGYNNGKGCSGVYNGSYGIKSINGHTVYRVDNKPTIFTNIHGNVAKGYILVFNVILEPCYIVKGNGYFAHGETLQEAQSALEEKIIGNIEEEEEV